MKTLLRTAAITASLLPALHLLPAPAQQPRNGVEVLQRMHDTYAGKWYHTLTFWQTTTMYRKAGTQVQTWYESLRYTPATGAQLRIDTGEPAEGNGTLNTADSGWSMRAGKLVRTDANGNPFLPIIEGVYMQPVSVTTRQIAALGIDTLKATTAMWQGKSVTVIGSASASDTISSQLWIDPAKMVAVRALLILAPNRPPYDIHLDQYEKTGHGWLATKVSMFVNGQPVQVEEYHDWKTDVTLDRGLFDPATWSSAKHWHHN
jgi:hypothetical protein